MGSDFLLLYKSYWYFIQPNSWARAVRWTENLQNTEIYDANWRHFAQRYILCLTKQNKFLSFLAVCAGGLCPFKTLNNVHGA